MKKFPLLGLCAFCFVNCSAFVRADDYVLETPQFAMTLKADNVFLPSTLHWKPQNREILAPQNGLGHEFVSFENREKIYHFENQGAYPNQTDPRFANDARVLGEAQTVTRVGAKGVIVKLQLPYAIAERTIWLGEDAPRISIEYAFEFTRDVVLHETQHFNAGVRFNENFDTQVVADVRRQPLEPLRASGLKSASYVASLLNSGPKLFVDAQHDTAILASTVIEGAPPQPAVKLLKINNGQKLLFRLDLELGPANDATLPKRLLEKQAALPEYYRPFALLETAHLLEANGNLKESEGALLLAAKLNLDYAAPFGALAGLRRDRKLPGQAQAWAEGAYRNPYNYGYMLSASRLHQDEKLTEEEKRMHLFNILIAVENAPFYPDYYSWAARGFEEMGMFAQAAAIYRQALWALGNAPYSAEKKEKTTKQFEKKLADLETKILGQTATDLPDLIPVRPAPS
jgi:hypothetical protein